MQQCPACQSAVPDDVRFCLHCGQYMGEPDEVTRVRASRRPPPTTIAASPFFSPRHNESYEHPTVRRWPGIVALSVLAGIFLMIVGGLIAIALIHDAGGVAIQLPDNSRLTVLTTPTPTPQATPRPTPSPRQIQTPAPTVEPRAAPTSEPLYAATPAPRVPVNRVVVEYSDWLKDGGILAWQLEPGVYRLDLSATNDGVTVAWGGGNCPNTPPVLRTSRICNMEQAGQLVINNPTTFGLGKPSAVVVRVTLLSR